MTGTYTITTTVGALHRRSLRRALQRATGITYTEERGLLDSQFVIRTSSKVLHDHWMATFNLLAERLQRSN